MIKTPNPKTKALRPKILLGLTTTPGSNWREKVKEIDELGIKEIALFPTYLKPNDRRILYKLLEGTSLLEIPHVHLRDDCDVEELKYLEKRWSTKVFNIHADARGLENFNKIIQFKDRIYLENLVDNIAEIRSSIDRCAGLCVDFSHWEAAVRLKDRPSYSNFLELVENNKIGCCHISAILTEPRFFPWGLSKKPTCSWHWMNSLNELDYLKNYTGYLPALISLELENSFKEQLKAKEYIEKLISQ